MYKDMSNIFTMPKFGISVECNNNGIIIPELKLMFDAMSKPTFDPEYIMITHAHADQCSSLPLKLSHTTIKTNVVTPNECVKSITNYVTAMFKMVNNAHNFIGVVPDDTYQLKNNMYFKVYDMDHVVPCRGYGLNAMRSQLKSEFTGIDRREMIRLKRTGVQLTDVIHEPLLVYMADTTVSVFKSYPELYKYPYIMIECKYLPIHHESYEEEMQMALDQKHVHWSLLLPMIEEHPENMFVLFHVSHRYTLQEINNFSHTLTMKNVIFAIPHSV
jgi:ribonuclease Z